MDIAQKKLVIQHVLSDWFHGESLTEAVIIWELKYSQQPTFAFQRFLSEICTTPLLQAQRSSMLQGLLRALTDETGRPLAAPRDEILAQLPASDPVLRITPPPSRDRLSTEEEDALSGFVQLVNTVFLRTPGDMNARMRALLLEKLPQLDLSLPAEDAIRHWLDEGGSGPENVFIAEGTLREMMRVMHGALCEFLSRGRADQVLKEALQQTASYYRGSFPLQKLWAA